MKKLFLLLAFVALSTFSFGQANSGLNFGIGLSNNGLPVYGSYDIPVMENISVAPVIQFNLSNFDWFVLGVRADYYFDNALGLGEQWDFYGGLNLGYFNYSGNDVNINSGLDLGLELGGRWFWNEMWGLNLEFSGGVGYGAKFGLTMKM
jgi:hypothetical protein